MPESGDSLTRGRSCSGFFSEQNLASCKHDGVKVACIPQRGGKKTAEREAHEKSADFSKASAFAPASRDASRCCSDVAA